MTGAGLTIASGQDVSFEVGYTWMRVFTRRGTNLNRVYGAVAFRF